MQTSKNTVAQWTHHCRYSTYEKEKKTYRSHGCPFTVRYAVVHTMPAKHISSVVGIFLFVMRLIWHGLNNYLPASDWHSHKKGWVGLGSRWWHSTWPNWSISMLGRRCSTGGQHHTIYFTIYGAQTHGHQSWHPEGLHAPVSRCAKVDDIRISHPLFHRMPRKGRKKNTLYEICNNSLAWDRLCKWRQSQGLPYFTLRLHWETKRKANKRGDIPTRPHPNIIH